MPIDVQDANLNLILNGCFYGLLVVAGTSLFPWRLRHGGNRWTLWLPLPALALYAVYERTMPVRFDIRLDLFVIWPLVGLTLLAWLVRVALLRRHR